MKRMMLALLLMFGALGCVHQEAREVRVRVVSVRADPDFGYIGEDSRTLVEVVGEGWRDEVPGVLGEPGDEFTAYAVEIRDPAGADVTRIRLQPPPAPEPRP